MGTYQGTTGSAVVKNHLDNAYNSYVSDFNKLGLTPQLSKEQFANTAGKWGEYQGGYISQILLPAYQAKQSELNELEKQYAEKKGLPYSPTQIDFEGDWRGKSADEILRQIQTTFNTKIDAVKTNIGGIKPTTGVESQGYKDLIAQLDSALKGGIIDQSKYDKYKTAADSGQYDTIRAQLTSDTTNFLRGDIDTGAPDLSTFEKPEFSMEQVQSWYDNLAQVEAPLEREQVKKVSEYYNAVNPYTTGSGAQIKATDEMLAKQIQDRYGRAMTLGQQDYEKAYNVALTDWENKYNDYWKRVQRGWGQTDYTNQRAGYTSDLATKRAQDLQDIATAYQQQTQQAYQNRNWANQDWNKQASLAEKLAKMSKPADQGWEKYLQPIMTGVGYGIGGPVGGAIGGSVAGLFKSNSNYYDPYEY